MTWQQIVTIVPLSAGVLVCAVGCILLWLDRDSARRPAPRHVRPGGTTSLTNGRQSSPAATALPCGLASPVLGVAILRWYAEREEQQTQALLDAGADRWH